LRIKEQETRLTLQEHDDDDEIPRILLSQSASQTEKASVQMLFYHCDITKIYLPLLLIKIGLIKIFVKTMDKESEGFAYLRQTFSKISDI
jgi:hypothetical protein